MNRRLLCVFLLVLSLALWSGCEERKVDVDNPIYPGDEDQTTDDDAGSEPWDENPARPIVTINQPTPGEFFTEGAVTVSGTVTGLPVDEVLVNGKPVAVNGGAFHAPVSFAPNEPVLPIYVSALTDTGRFGADRVAVIRGEMSEPQERIEDGLVVGLGNDIFPLIGGVVANVFDQLDLGPFFAQLNPIIDFLGIIVNVTAATVGGGSFTGEFTDDGLHIYGELTDLSLTTELTTPNGTSTTTVTIDSMSLDLVADALVYSGYVTVAINSLDVAHGRVTYEGPLPRIIGAWGTSLLLDIVEGVVEWAAQSLLPDALVDVLSSLVLDTVQIGFDIHAGLSYLEIGPGAAMAGVTLNLFLTDPNPHPWPQGSLFEAGDAPDMLTARPPEARHFGLALALSQNFLNRFLYSAAEAELLDFNVGDPAYADDPIPLPLSAGLLAGLMPGFEVVDPDTPATLHLAPMVPAIAVARDSGALTLYVPDYRVEFYLHPPDTEPWRALTMSVAVESAIDLNLDPDGAIRISLPGGVVLAQILDDPIGEGGVVTDVLADWLTQLIMPALDTILRLLPIQLPNIAGVAFDPLWLGTAGENQTFWTGYVGLEYEPSAR